jgi:hypothetical protein
MELGQQVEIRMFQVMNGTRQIFSQPKHKHGKSDLLSLVDIMERSNQLKEVLQDRDNLLHGLYTTVQTFQANTILFLSQVKESKFTHLSTLQNPHKLVLVWLIRAVSLLISCMKNSVVDFEKVGHKIQVSLSPEKAPHKLQLRLTERR